MLSVRRFARQFPGKRKIKVAGGAGEVTFGVIFCGYLSYEAEMNSAV